LFPKKRKRKRRKREKRRKKEEKKEERKEEIKEEKEEKKGKKEEKKEKKEEKKANKEGTKEKPNNDSNNKNKNNNNNESNTDENKNSENHSQQNNNNKNKNKKQKDENKEDDKKSSKAKGKEKVVIARADIKVGKVLTAKPHPSRADMLVLEVDVGLSSPRCVCATISALTTVDRIKDTLVVIQTNLKALAFDVVTSNGLLMVADGKEILMVPKGAKVGESITFDGIEGDVDPSMDSKHFSKLKKEIHTSDKCVAEYKNIPWMTSAGPITVPSLKNAPIANK